MANHKWPGMPHQRVYAFLFLCLKLVREFWSRQGSIFRFQFFRKKISSNEIQAKQNQAKPNQGTCVIIATSELCKVPWKSCEGIAEGGLRKAFWRGDLVVKGDVSSANVLPLKRIGFIPKHILYLENFEDSITQASSKATVPFIIYLKLLMAFFLVRAMKLKEF